MQIVKYDPMKQCTKCQKYKVNSNRYKIKG